MVEVVQADRDVLEPCGNCHAPARWVELAWRVKCTRPSCGVEGGKFERRREAIAAWNTRAHLTPNTDLSDERAREVLADAQRGKPDRHLGMVSHADALRAMHQYAAGLQGEVEALKHDNDRLRSALNSEVNDRTQRDEVSQMRDLIERLAGEPFGGEVWERSRKLERYSIEAAGLCNLKSQDEPR